MKRRRALAIVMLILLPIIFLQGQKNDNRPDVADLVKEIDQLYRSESSYSRVEMDIVTPHWERTLKMKVWTEGMKKTFIRITAPEKENGTATLRIENEMWNYLPRTNKVIKIPPSMMMNAWMGSDFTNDDLVKEFSLFDDYTYEYTDVKDPKPDQYYILCKPKEGRPIVWSSLVLAVRKSDHMPVFQKYYDDNDNLTRIMQFSDYKVFDKRKIPAVMEMLPQDEKGNRTTLRYLEIDFSADIDQNTFSLRNLRSQ